jgi:hypothetical protein
MVDEYNRASLGYDGFAYLEGSYRTDRSSTTTKANNKIWFLFLEFSFSSLIDAHLVIILVKQEQIT